MTTELYDSLLQLVKSEPINDGTRAYCVTTMRTDDAKLNFVVANSPAQAALALCAVVRVNRNDLLKAAMQAIHDAQAKPVDVKTK